MSKQSVPTFRLLFFVLIFGNLIFALLIGWLLWKIYPLLKEAGGFKQLFQPLPLKPKPETEES